MLRSFGEGLLFGGRTGDGPPRVLALHGWRRAHADFDAVLLGPPGLRENLGASGMADGVENGVADGVADGVENGVAAGEASDVLAALAPDLPGFGATPPPPEPWGSADYAARVAEVLDQLAAQGGEDSPRGPMVVLAHSFGGRVALHLAATRPDLVRALVLTGVPHLVAVASPRRRSPLPYRTWRRLHRMGLVGDERMEAARQRYGSPDYRAAEGVMREVFVRLVQERYDEQVAAVRCPVTLVWGERDTEAPLRVAELAAPRFADARLEVLPGVGHLVPIEAPAALRRQLEARL